MKKTRLGATDVSVSQMCLGTMYFGTKVDQQQSEKLLDYFLDHGGNFIDTSNNYAFWIPNASGDESELLLGKWLTGKQREQIVLATKCGARPIGPYNDLSDIQLEGLGYETIIRSVEGSLQRLSTDYIDVLYGHVDFMEYPIEERLEAFSRLQQEGKIRFIGTSNTMPWRIEESQQWSQLHHKAAYVCIQQRYTYLQPKQNADFWVQKLIDDEMLTYCRAKGNLSLLAYSTLLSGAYVRYPEKPLPTEYDTPDNQLRMEILLRVAAEADASTNQVVLAWLMQHEPTIIPLVAASKMTQLEDSLLAEGLQLTEEQMARLDRKDY